MRLIGGRPDDLRSATCAICRSVLVRRVEGLIGDAWDHHPIGRDCGVPQAKAFGILVWG